MSKKPVNLQLDQGSTFAFSAVWADADGVPRDLTGFSARMQLRTDYANATPAVSMSTANGEITITPASGKIDVMLGADRTALIPIANSASVPPKQKYVYDLEMVSSSNVVTKILYGTCEVWGEVTK